jgi:hypothetical protein
VNWADQKVSNLAVRLELQRVERWVAKTAAQLVVLTASTWAD